MIINYLPSGINNFHNSPSLALRVSGKISNATGEPLYVISAQQAARISKRFCGISDCRCPQGAAIQINESATEFGIRPSYAAK